jgi:hypothetical protein
VNPVELLLEQGAAGGADVDGAPAAHLIAVRFPFWVQSADLVRCAVEGCAATAVPEMWEPVDLDTGDEQPGRFCTEHELAWLTRPRETTSTTGESASS